jgi:integrase
VPQALRGVIGTREIKVSLRTKDLREAKQLAHEVAAQVERQLSEARAGRRTQLPLLSKTCADRTRLLDPGEHENPKLSAVLAAWLAERRPASKTASEWGTAVRRFTELVGHDIPIGSINKAHVRVFKEALQRTPRAMPAAMRAMALPVILRASEGIPGARLTPGSIQKQLGALQSLFTWAKRNYDGIGENPFDGMKPVDLKAAKEKRRSYDADDLAAIFSSPLFTGNQEAKAGAMAVLRRAKPGSRVVRDKFFWLPLLALYTGARLEELGQLRLSDIRSAHGIDFLDLNTIDEGKSLKTATSRRCVPVHPELVRLGFLDHVRELRSVEGRMLFPELKPDKHGKLTSAFSKAWRRYCDRIGVYVPQKTFHSFRHTFEDAGRRARVPEEIRDALTGHASGGIGRMYGDGVPLEVLAEEIARINYECVQL